MGIDLYHEDDGYYGQVRIYHEACPDGRIAFTFRFVESMVELLRLIWIEFDEFDIQVSELDYDCILAMLKRQERKLR